MTDELFHFDVLLGLERMAVRLKGTGIADKAGGYGAWTGRSGFAQDTRF